MVDDEALECRPVGALYNASGNLLRGPILHADHGGLAHGSPPGVRQLLAAGIAHVSATAAEVALGHFDRTREYPAFLRQRHAETVREEPGAALVDA